MRTSEPDLVLGVLYFRRLTFVLTVLKADICVYACMCRCVKIRGLARILGVFLSHFGSFLLTLPFFDSFNIYCRRIGSLTIGVESREFGFVSIFLSHLMWTKVIGQFFFDFTTGFSQSLHNTEGQL
ncbi:hypothetical protein CDAR_467451 [Caerostris darwini]|uniref:Uncharacterized protein n=1 Tax=Caerostris darwini TaxID=1538125 RepID=A0AAV4RNV9_9ARAC|nr:hypothetical protein CDAR_467451 [Caerostris darwini]